MSTGKLFFELIQYLSLDDDHKFTLGGLNPGPTVIIDKESNVTYCMSLVSNMKFNSLNRISVVTLGYI